MLTIQNTEAIRRIEEAIGYTFNDKRLLVQVLTRKTYLKIDPEAPDNEVLEFYGDTLMNYHVTNYFMSKYAHMLDDGLFFMRTVEQFTDMRSHYVCNRYLTDRIKAMGLARYLRAQHRDSELRRDSEKAYADIFESLVGAIYLDSYQNDSLIRAFILRQLGIEPKRAPEEIENFDYDSLAYRIPEITPPAVSVSEDEPVTLSEASAETVAPVETPAPARAIPAVEEALEEAPVSEAAVDLDAETPDGAAPVAETVAEPVTDTAEAIAIEETAPALLPAEPVPVVEPAALPMPMQEALAEFCRRHGLEQPTYGETPKNAPNARPVAACTMKYKDAKGKLVKISLNDSGKTLAEATEKAAAKMLKKLEKQVADTARKEENPPKREKASAPTTAVTPVADVIEAAVRAVLEAAETAEAAESSADVPAAESQETAPAVVEPLPVAEAETAAETPAEEVTDAPAAEASEETAPPVAEIPAARETEAVETDAVAEVAPAEEATPAEETAPTETAPVVETPAEVNPAQSPSDEAIPASEAAAEAAPAETPKPARAPRKRKTESAADGEKPARKSPGRKKAAPKAEETAETASDAKEEAAPSDPPAAEVKPRARKPRAKKPAESAETPEIQDTAEAPVPAAETKPAE